MIAPGKCPATSKAVFCAPAPAPKSKVPVYCFGIDGMHRIQMPPMLRKGELLPISELRFVDFVDHIIQVNPPIPSAGLRNIRNSFNVYVAEHYKGMALTDAQKYKVTSQSKGGSRNPGVKEATARALNHFAGTGQQHPPTFPSPAQQSVPVDLTGPSVEPKIYATRGSTSVAKPNDVVGKIPEARMPPNFKVSAAGVSSVKNPDQVSWLDADMDDVDSIDDEDEESGEIISGEDKPESVLEDTVPEGAIGEDDFAEKTDTAKTISEVVFSEAEVILAQKYFPAAEDVAFKPRCLACAETTHSTLNCPLLTCGVCSGSHTTFQCIENHLCGRCRQRGHPATQCIEKLLPIRSEMTCDFCNSVTHLEDSCQRNWRTYLPKLDEIVPRSNVPVFCYYCGGSGHYGDECGLQRINQSDSEGTWSRSSREMYAITITPVDVKPKNRGFSIKGKANDPITLDDSDDEVEFVRPKINNPPARQRRDFGPGSGAHMKIDSNNSRGLPPAPRQKLGTNYPSQPPLPHASIPPYTAVQQYGSLPTAPLTKTKYPDAPVYPHQGGAPSRPKQGHPPSSSRGGFSALAGRGGLGFNGGQRAGISTRGGGNFGAPKNSNKRKAKKNAAAPAAAQANNGVAKKPKKPRIKAKHKGGPQ
ncbi:hypothetical protein BJ878DRAFT_258158 [Calycina marina]|uniref:CCHC-type domain-containing protein n=1 Tax=Calycina marina TaxID=1763456 RepID=A0A9P7Z7L3_9HELO|nr:hypothetical protein BJ878DRAFT_258158 [Calycina marina]